MSARSVLWSQPRRFDRWLAAIGTRIAAITRSNQALTSVMSEDDFLSADKVPSDTVQVMLGRSAAYSVSFDPRTRSLSEIQKIANNEVVRLDPLGGHGSLPFGDARSSNEGLAKLLLVKPATVDGLEAKAWELGVRRLFLSSTSDESVRVSSPTTARQARTSATIWLVATLLTLLAAWAATATISVREAASLDLLKAEELRLRALVAERRDQERQVTALEQLAAQSADQVTVAGQLARLKALNDATPDGSWWIAYETTGQTARISGLAGDAAATRTAMASALPDHSVRFDEAVSDGDNGSQSYVIAIEPRP